MLKLTFLGTSAGVPTKQRNVTALAVACLNPYIHQPKRSLPTKSKPWVLIDCGEGTQQQLLRTKHSLHHLVAICITHVHGDHCYGLPGLLASTAMSKRRQPLTIIAPEAIKLLIEVVQATTHLHLPYAIDFVSIESVLSIPERCCHDAPPIDHTPSSPLRLTLDAQQHLEIDITRLSHRVPSYGFGLTHVAYRPRLNKDKLMADGIAPSAVWGELQQGRAVTTPLGDHLDPKDYVERVTMRTRIVVAGDNDTPECLNKAVQQTDLLVHEATYTQDVLAKIKSTTPAYDPMHSSAQQVGQFAERYGVDNLILTHFSARYQSFDDPNSPQANLGHLREETQRHYTGKLWMACDFAEYLVTGRSQAIHSAEDHVTISNNAAVHNDIIGAPTSRQAGPPARDDQRSIATNDDELSTLPDDRVRYLGLTTE